MVYNAVYNVFPKIIDVVYEEQGSKHWCLWNTMGNG